MHLSDATKGQRILVYYSPRLKAIMVGPDCRAVIPGELIITIPATVLRENNASFAGVVLGWKSDEVRPQPITSAWEPVPPEWIPQDFVAAQRYGSHCECLPSDQVAATSPKEKPCKQCGRNNDVGVSKCWLCEAANPTT